MSKGKPTMKEPSRSVNPNEFYYNMTELDADLIEELKSKKLEYRFINRVQFQKNGFHRSHWKPYRREATSERSAADKLFGADPDGFVIRGDLILAVKSAEAASQHRDFLDRKNKILSRSAKSSEQASRLRQEIQGLGKDAQIHETEEDD